MSSKGSSKLRVDLLRSLITGLLVIVPTIVFWMVAYPVLLRGLNVYYFALVVGLAFGLVAHKRGWLWAAVSMSGVSAYYFMDIAWCMPAKPDIAEKTALWAPLLVAAVMAAITELARDWNSEDEWTNDAEDES